MSEDVVLWRAKMSLFEWPKCTNCVTKETRRGTILNWIFPINWIQFDKQEPSFLLAFLAELSLNVGKNKDEILENFSLQTEN